MKASIAEYSARPEVKARREELRNKKLWQSLSSQELAAVDGLLQLQYYL